MNWSPSIHVFVGPTLWDTDLGQDVSCCPPAQGGDLLAHRAETPCTLVLIDGLFDACRAPWHREILELRALGFRVIGAASLGALRAAELDRFGMVGIGAIYNAFRSGALVADDEVAITHAPAQFGFQPFTKSLVDVRAALQNELAHGRIAPAQALGAFEAAREVSFRDRDGQAMARIASDHDLPTEPFDPGVSGLKAQDALRAIGFGRKLRDTPSTIGEKPPFSVYLRHIA